MAVFEFPALECNGCANEEDDDDGCTENLLKS